AGRPGAEGVHRDAQAAGLVAALAFAALAFAGLVGLVALLPLAGVAGVAHVGRLDAERLDAVAGVGFQLLTGVALEALRLGSGKAPLPGDLGHHRLAALLDEVVSELVDGRPQLLHVGVVNPLGLALD